MYYIHVAFQDIDDNHWIVKNTSGLVTDGYTVSKKSAVCSECSVGPDVCRYSECGFLCCHLYTCDHWCYDYGNGTHMQTYTLRIYIPYNNLNSRGQMNCGIRITKTSQSQCTILQLNNLQKIPPPPVMVSMLYNRLR